MDRIGKKQRGLAQELPSDCIDLTSSLSDSIQNELKKAGLRPGGSSLGDEDTDDGADGAEQHSSSLTVGGGSGHDNKNRSILVRVSSFARG